MKNYYLFLALSAFSIQASAQAITWSSTIDVATNSYNNEHPRVVTDASGNPIVLWGNSSSEEANFSRWNGVSFTTPISLSGSMNIASQSWMGPDIASKGDTVYTVYKQNPESDTSSHIYIKRSFDGGMNFSAPVQVDNILDSISRFPTVTIDVNGQPIVAFMKFDPSFGDARWVVTRSNDYGNTFDTDKKASGWTGGTVCDCCPGAITAKGNDVMMMYRANLSNIRDTWVGMSNDGGSTFTNGWNADQNNWMLMMCPSSGPDGAIIGDTLYSTFMSGATGNALVYWSKSALSDISSQPTELLTGTIAGLNSQNYPRLGAQGNSLAIVWKQNISGTDELVIRFAENINNGLPDYSIVDMDNIANADVALSDGTIHVVWEDNVTGTVKYRKGTFVSTAGLDETSSFLPIVYPNPSNTVWTISSVNENVELRLFDELGVMHSSSFKRSNDKVEIDNAFLSKGIYFLEMKHNGNIKTIQLVKN